MEIVVILLITATAVVAVMHPLLRGRSTMRDAELDAPEGSRPTLREPGAVEREIERYRAALRAGTVCRRCGCANPEGSRFCFECGRRLPNARRLRLRVKNAA
jgi:hypothetical protein